MYITEAETKQLLDVHYHDHADEGRLFVCLFLVRAHKTRAKAMLYKGVCDSLLLQEAVANHFDLFRDISEYRKRVTYIEKDIEASSPHRTILEGVLPQVRRVLCICLAVGIMSSCLLGAINPENDWHRRESAMFVEEIMHHSQDADSLLPMGHGFRQFSLIAAWIGTDDEALRTSLEQQLSRSRQQSRYSPSGFSYSVHSLDWMAKEIRLLNRPADSKTCAHTVMKVGAAEVLQC
jgi:hypothetical protein